MNCPRPIRVGLNFVPCGKCPACLANRRQEWIFRLRSELLACRFGLFVTLTYDDDHLPHEGVNRRDLQLFLKRLRKRLGNRSFRYFITTEYGDNTHRAHAHGLFFFQTGERCKKLYDDITESWQNGFVSFGDIEEGSIVYCTKYCLKKTAVPEGKNKTFQLMSKMPGIGYNHLEEFGDFYEKKQDFSIAYLPGVKSRMPRFYRERLYMDSRTKLDLQYLAQKRQFIRLQKSFEAYKRRYGSDKTFDDYIKFMKEGQERKNDLIIKHTKKQKM